MGQGVEIQGGEGSREAMPAVGAWAVHHSVPVAGLLGEKPE